MTEFDERFNGFGVALTVPHFFDLVGELGHSLSEDSVSDLSDVVGEWTYRMMVTEATGRWRFRGGRAEPSRLVPGDVVALSALYAAGLVGERSDDGSSALYPEGTSIARRVLDAGYFWLPANTVEAVLSSDRPDASMLPEVSLPHRSARCGSPRPLRSRPAPCLTSVPWSPASPRSPSATSSRWSPPSPRWTGCAAARAGSRGCYSSPTSPLTSMIGSPGSCATALRARCRRAPCCSVGRDAD
jgi:hypothetical protein